MTWVTNSSAFAAEIVRLREIAERPPADAEYRATITPATVLGLIEALELLLHLHSEASVVAEEAMAAHREAA